MSYGLALEGLVDDGKGSERLFGRLTELIFRGLASEASGATHHSRDKHGEATTRKGT
jgi:hypothetical protein